MDWGLFASLTVTVLIAVAGYFWKYASDRALDRQRGQLERVNRQLGELYGPLWGITHIGTDSYANFWHSIRPDGASFADRPLTQEEAPEYRLWISEVLLPLNQRLVELVLSKADLLEEDFVPDTLRVAAANVLEVEALVKRWEHGDYSRLQAYVPFPTDELHEYTDRMIRELKQRQAGLLRRVN